MPEPTENTISLLNDAKLVAAYSARAGRLADDRLATAIAACEAPSTSVDQEKRFSDLIMALNVAMKAIAPITLRDLGSKWQPFPRSSHYLTWRVLFLAFAILIIVLTGFYTQIYTRTNVILSQLTAIQSQNEIDKSERLYRFFTQNYQQLFPTDQTSANASTVALYLQSYEDLLTLDGQLTTYLPLSCDVIESAQPFLGWIGIAKGEEANPVCGNLIATYKDRGTSYAQAPSAAGTLPMGAPSASAALAGAAPSAVIAAAATSGDMQVSSLYTDEQHMNEFLVQAGIPDAVNRQYGSNYLMMQIYRCQQLTAWLGVWLLPALYGLLGAAVYQMRAILNPMLPDPDPMRLILRLSLGGFAGIIFLLMFGSSSAEIANGAKTIDIGAFGVAFLLGFSVDIFFALLDRLVNGISQSLVQSSK
jgi:hypothetical protein